MSRRVAALVLAFALAATACNKEASALSAEEQAFAHVLAAEWAAGADFGVDDESSRCLGEGLVGDFGVERLTELGYGVDGLTIDDVRFDLLTEEEVDTLGARIVECVDLTAALVEGMVDGGLDEASAECIADALNATDFFIDLLMMGYAVSFDENRLEENLGPELFQFMAVVFSALAECVSAEDFAALVEGGIGLPVGEVGPLPEPPTAPQARTRQISLMDLALGDCFDEPDSVGDHPIVTVPLVRCAEPHDYEVFFVFELPDGPYPGEDEVWDLADEACFDEFEAFVGASYFESDLEFFPLIPTADSWPGGDRLVQCVLFATDPWPKLVGSMRGVGPPDPGEPGQNS